MNQRIRELAVEARLLTGWPAGEVEYQKFAELIVKDVFDRFGDEILSLHYLEQKCCQDSVHLLKSKIQEHFGVEE